VVGSDSVIHDPPRIMRLPGFRNHKAPAADCDVLHLDPEMRYALGDLCGDAPRKPAPFSAGEQSEHSPTTGEFSHLSPDDVIVACLPEKEGERNGKIMSLARGLKFEAGMADESLPRLKPFVRKWHSLALPTIHTKEFDITWADFVPAFTAAHTPLTADLPARAFAAAKATIESGHLPECAAAYESIEVRQLLLACRYMAKHSPSGVFFLSCRKAAEYLPICFVQASRYLKMLVVDGMLELHKLHTEREATRYKWIGDEA
jgi:hypothetical protein